MNIKVGEIYTIKPGCETECGTYNNEKRAKQIKVTSVRVSGALCYDILDSNNTKLDDCSYCFKPKHLIPQTKTSYNLGIGDEIELLGEKRTILSVLPSSPENPIYILSSPYKNDTDHNKKQTSCTLLY